MFISSMVLQWIMTFSSYQQNDQECMKPQFQWLECWTHVWPSMEDVNLSFFCADKRQVYPRRHWNFGWSNTFREKHKHCKTQCKINIFHIHTNKMQLASGEPPAFTLYIYTHMNVNAMMMWADVWMVLQWYHNCSCIHAMMVILFVFPLCERDPALAWKSMVWTNASPLPGICHCQEATVTKSVVSTCAKLIGPKLIWNLILYTKDAQFCRSTPFIHTHPFVQRKTIYIYIFCINCCFVTFAFFSAWLVPRILHLMYLRFHIFSCLWNSLLQPPAAVPANQFRYQEASVPLILTFNRIDF